MPSLLAVPSLLATFLLAAPAQVLRVPNDAQASVLRAEVLASNKHQRIRALLADAVSTSLPAGWRVEDVQLQGGPSPFARRNPHDALVGAARIEANLLGPLRAGRQAVAVIVSDDKGPLERRQASVTLRRPVGGQGVKRGTEVNVSLRSGNVFVQARCTAQHAAEVGEGVVVLCDNATRTLGATVVSAKDVEVTL